MAAASALSYRAYFELRYLIYVPYNFNCSFVITRCLQVTHARRCYVAPRIVHCNESLFTEEQSKWLRRKDAYSDVELRSTVDCVSRVFEKKNVEELAELRGRSRFGQAEHDDCWQIKTRELCTA
jgi:hypothetical protein